MRIPANRRQDDPRISRVDCVPFEYNVPSNQALSRNVSGERDHYVDGSCLIRHGFASKHGRGLAEAKHRRSRRIEPVVGPHAFTRSTTRSDPPVKLQTYFGCVNCNTFPQSNDVRNLDVTPMQL